MFLTHDDMGNILKWNELPHCSPYTATCVISAWVSWEIFDDANFAKHSTISIPTGQWQLRNHLWFLKRSQKLDKANQIKLEPWTLSGYFETSQNLEIHLNYSYKQLEHINRLKKHTLIDGNRLWNCRKRWPKNRPKPIDTISATVVFDRR